MCRVAETNSNKISKKGCFTLITIAVGIPLVIVVSGDLYAANKIGQLSQILSREIGPPRQETITTTFNVVRLKSLGFQLVGEDVSDRELLEYYGSEELPTFDLLTLSQNRIMVEVRTKEGSNSFTWYESSHPTWIAVP